MTINPLLSPGLSRKGRRIAPFGIYLDFPFCIARCAFCDFNIQGYREGPAVRYLTALRKEIECHARLNPDFRARGITSLYLGGGTPTLYAPAQIAEILLDCRNHFNLTPDAEITLEAHPATIHASNLASLRAAGVNRLSIGVQSFCDDILEMMGRHHTAEDARCALHVGRETGFDNIGIDLIYAIPGQTERAWETTLEAAVRLSPDHIAVYGLSVEEGTLFHKQGRSPMPDTASAAQYQIAQLRLSEAGYAQYEISNFARPGFACRHNLLYWDRDDILGIGLSAHSYLGRTHHRNTGTLPDYLAALDAGRLPVEWSESLDAATHRQDQVIFGLRKSVGIPQHFLIEAPTLARTAESLRRDGLLVVSGDHIRLTLRGMLLADEVAMAFL